MILDQRIEEVFVEKESLLAELSGDLDIPAINATQRNGKLLATNKRLLFFCNVDNQLRYDSFYYEKIDRIAVRRSFRNEQRLLFEADDEIQMLHNIKNIEDIEHFLEIVENQLKK
ncbi:MAG: hypothetical protein KBT36_07810 [Kurthia sp.]|nr:hypothetical protein [Candidatus Kurthia equi]